MKIRVIHKNGGLSTLENVEKIILYSGTYQAIMRDGKSTLEITEEADDQGNPDTSGDCSMSVKYHIPR